MKIKYLFIGVIALMIVLFILSVTKFKLATIDIHLHDTYYVIGAGYVALFFLITSHINLLLYNLRDYQSGTVSNGLCILHIAFFLLSMLLLFWTLGKSPGFYLQSLPTFYNQYFNLLTWALLSFLFSELLILVYFFLPKKRIL